MRAAEDIEIAHPLTALFGQVIMAIYPLQQALPTQMRQIRPRGARGIVETPNQITGMYASELSGEKQRLMLVGFHSRIGSKTSVSGGFTGNCANQE